MKMQLGGKGPAELGKTQKKMIHEATNPVGPEHAAMVPNKKEAIEACCTKSEFKGCCSKN